MNNSKKFIIGTAQIGQVYGLNKASELNNYTAGVKFIDEAIELGCTMFDTAQAYGKSEKIIGRRKNINNIKIFTKIPKLKESNIEEINKYLYKSMDDLNVKNIEGLFYITLIIEIFIILMFLLKIY